uniref:BPTI/Kunitz inhibitor domain-containing protein n=1 Tax=Salarias fasciatus TaxID=181472 RepID=A0A672GL28_SALFA
KLVLNWIQRWSVCLLLSSGQISVDSMCVVLPARCLLRADVGTPCQRSVRAWFFDTKLGACSAFWFGGCGGNANRFKSESECFRTCGIHSNLMKSCCPTVPSSVHNFRIFNSNFLVLICSFHVIISNANVHNFSIFKMLKMLTSPIADACFLPQDQGDCQTYTMMWFFDTEQNECARFWYGGCGGNQNRFKTQEECQRPTRPHASFLKTEDRKSSKCY